MKKLVPLFIIGLIATSSLLLASAANANYYNTPQANTKFHPQSQEYYNGNHRLKLKKRADIERASAPNVHYDKYNRDLYRCNWIYNKNLGTWVCEKDLLRHKAQEVKVCPYGYKYNTAYDRCDKVYIPAPTQAVPQPTSSNTANNQVVAVNQPQDVEVTQYVYIYDEEHTVASNTYPKPTSLPSTGSGLTLSALIAGAYAALRRRLI